MKRIIALSVAMLATSAASANQFNIGLNDTAIHLDFNAQLADPIIMTGGYDYNEDEGHMLDIGAAISHRQAHQEIGLGAKYFHVWPDRDETANAVGLGGYFKAQIGERLAYFLEGYYAPSVLAFNDLESLGTLDTRLEVIALPNVQVGLGYKLTSLDYKRSGDFDFDNELYINFGITF